MVVVVRALALGLHDLFTKPSFTLNVSKNIRQTRSRVDSSEMKTRLSCTCIQTRALLSLFHWKRLWAYLRKENHQTKDELSGFSSHSMLKGSLLRYTLTVRPDLVQTVRESLKSVLLGLQSSSSRAKKPPASVSDIYLGGGRQGKWHNLTSDVTRTSTSVSRPLDLYLPNVLA